MMQFRRVCGLFAAIFLTGLCYAEKATEDKFYKPVIGFLEGWKIEWDPEIAESHDATFYREIRKALSNHFQRIKFLLPKEKVKELQTLIIRVDKNHPLTNMQYHPSKGWLISNGYDPTLEKECTYPVLKIYSNEVHGKSIPMLFCTSWLIPITIKSLALKTRKSSKHTNGRRKKAFTKKCYSFVVVKPDTMLEPIIRSSLLK